LIAGLQVPATGTNFQEAEHDQARSGTGAVGDGSGTGSDGATREAGAEVSANAGQLRLAKSIRDALDSMGTSAVVEAVIAAFEVRGKRVKVTITSPKVRK
jgi:hypothetical protein